MKVVLIASFAKSLIQFRGKLISDLVASGADVVALAPDDSPDAASDLKKIGARFVPYFLSRASLNPLRDLRSCRELVKILRKERPDAVLSYTAKPMTYGSFAAGRARVGQSFSMVTGLGYSFSGHSFKQRLLRFVQLSLYRRAFRQNKLVIFQNEDDRAEFVRLKVVPRDKTRVVAGSGIDLEKYPVQPIEGSKITFLMIARLLHEKGVAEYCQAAGRISEVMPGQCEFILVGGEDPNPGGISAVEMKEWLGPVKWVGEQQDVCPYLTESTCYVLPSYREGTPRSTLEALSTGRPVITTDAVGCRETVEEGVNGWLVPPRDANALSEAMICAASLPIERLREMGSASRALAEQRFDVQLVNRNLLDWIKE